MARPRLSRARMREFWIALRSSSSSGEAAARVGVSKTVARGWITEAGGVSPDLRAPSGRYLSQAEREVIDLGLADGMDNAQIARLLGRHPSTIGRELARNSAAPRHPGGPVHYRAAPAHTRAEQRARRPKPTKLSQHPQLVAEVQAGLTACWSPEEISATLRRRYPDQPEMQVSHETIYQELYVQGRGELRRELHRCLRSGRALRKTRRTGTERRGRIPDMVMISDRPAEVTDRSVPGHWEGDLIIGRNGTSAIGTLVERSTRFTMLLHLPGRHSAEHVRDAMIATMPTLPVALRRSLTWDQGAEMAKHAEITVALDLPIYFCDPHSPWQRGSNENTNGLLRQYFPKATNLSVHTAADLVAVAAQLNARPRKTLSWDSPAEAMARLLSRPVSPDVATTP